MSSLCPLEYDSLWNPVTPTLMIFRTTLKIWVFKQALVQRVLWSHSWPCFVDSVVVLLVPQSDLFLFLSYCWILVVCYCIVFKWCCCTSSRMATEFSSRQPANQINSIKLTTLAKYPFPLYIPQWECSLHTPCSNCIAWNFLGCLSGCAKTVSLVLKSSFTEDVLQKEGGITRPVSLHPPSRRRENFN